MKYRLHSIHLLIIMATGIAWSQAVMANEIDTTASQPVPEQGTIIECEECVVLYPEKYSDDPESCHVCRGRKEHFQPARMMDQELAAAEGADLDAKIRNTMFEMVASSSSEPVKAADRDRLRRLYYRKLIHVMIYDPLQTGEVADHIRRLDALARGE